MDDLDEYIDDSVKFKIKNGILYDYYGSDSEVIIPDGVKVIGSWLGKSNDSRRSGSYKWQGFWGLLFLKGSNLATFV